jgi:hypothetical protein
VTSHVNPNSSTFRDLHDGTESTSSNDDDAESELLRLRSNRASSLAQDAGLPGISSSSFNTGRDGARAFQVNLYDVLRFT